LLANTQELVFAAALGVCCGLAGTRFARHYTRKIQSESPSGVGITACCISWCVLALLTTGVNFGWFAVSCIGAMLITASAIDLKVLLLPDVLTLPAAALSIPVSIFLIGNSPEFALYGALAGSGFFYIIAAIYEKIRKRSGLGMGDVKLLLSLGAFTGPSGIFYAITFGSMLLLLWSIPQLLFSKQRASRMQTALPYGPFLCLGAMSVFMLQ
jgi:leader peptidase (prepilin peptidase)/N-methyltransferase